MLAAGAVLIGEAMLTIGQGKLDLEVVSKQHREVAFVVQANERLTKLG